MGKLINFPGEMKYSSEVKLLKKTSDEFDDLIIRSLSENDVDSKELAALIAHRFGSLLALVPEKAKLWKVCSKIICAQAGIKGSS